MLTLVGVEKNSNWEKRRILPSLQGTEGGESKIPTFVVRVLASIFFPSKITEFTCPELLAVHRCHRSIFRCLKCTQVQVPSTIQRGSEHSVPLFKKKLPWVTAHWIVLLLTLRRGLPDFFPLRFYLVVSKPKRKHRMALDFESMVNILFSFPTPSFPATS